MHDHSASWLAGTVSADRVTLTNTRVMCCLVTMCLRPRIVCRALVHEDDAAVALLVAEKTYKRPQIWEVPENAERLQGIRSTDR